MQGLSGGRGVEQQQDNHWFPILKSYFITVERRSPFGLLHKSDSNLKVL